MTRLPNFDVGPVTLTAILYLQPALDIRHSRRLPKNSDTMKLKRIFQVTINIDKNLPYSAEVSLRSFGTRPYYTEKWRSLCQSLAMSSGYLKSLLLGIKCESTFLLIHCVYQLSVLISGSISLLYDACDHACVVLLQTFLQ